MQKIDWLAITACVVFLAIFGYMSHLDYEAEQAAAAHAKECQEAAQQAALIRRNDWNRLAKRGAFYTGMEAKQ